MDSGRPDESPAAPRRLARTAGSNVFGTDIAGYHNARSGYPPELYAAIAARRPMGGRALEIGPGTGLATRDILEKLAPAELVAVEPDPALAAHLRETITTPRFSVVTGGFVEAEVDGMFDLACAAASFHWLEPEPALAKLRRLLRPGATIALWWNTYRQRGADAFADAVAPLLEDVDLAPSEGAAGHYSLDTEFHVAQLTGAGFTDVTAHLFRRERTLDTAQLRALYASYSYVRALPTDQRDALLDAIVDLAEREFGGEVPNAVLSALYLGTAP